MLWFKKKTKSYLGVDIGTSAIKLVELGKEEGRYTLKNYGIYSLSEYLRQWSEQKIDLEMQKVANDELAEMVKAILKETEIETRETFFSIPVYSSFSTLVDFPEMPKKEIVSAINFEAKRYIPIPLSEVMLDWTVVESTDKKSGMQVLLIAVPKDIVNDYGQVSKLAGLRLQSLEAETFSLSRVLVGNDKSAIILIDTGARSSNISIIDRGFIRLTNNLEIGGLKFTKSIVEQMNISQAEAEKRKKEWAKGQRDAMAENMTNSFLNSIAVEAKKIINNYQNKYNRKLEKCILTGGAIQIVGVTNYFSKVLNIETSWGDPFARIAYPSVLKPMIRDLSPLLGVAIGVAMR